MGKWDRRWIPRRRNNRKKYRDYDYEEPPPSPPSPHHPQSNPPPIQENCGSSWEIEFCKSVRVPWKKVVAAKHYMYCYDSVAKWDDSASEEAFHDAKNRYWEKINCLPYDTPLPDEDMYIDEINWNPDIDPKLITDLDREYFNPYEVGKGDPAQGVGTLKDNWGQNTASINSKDVTNPWEQSYTLFDESLTNNAWKTSTGAIPAQGDSSCWGQNAKSINSKGVSNPWEPNCTQVDEFLTSNAWKGYAGENPARGVRTYWGQNAKSINSKDVSNPWEQSCTRFDDSFKNNAWKGSTGESPVRGVRTQWGQNAKSINSKDVSNPWEQSCTQLDDSLKDNTWKGSAGESPAQGVRTYWGQNAESINSKDVNPWDQICTPADESLFNKAWNGFPEESSGWRKQSTSNRLSTDDNKNAGDKGWTHADNRSRGRKQWKFSTHEQQYPVDTGNTLQRSSPSHTGGFWGSRGWTEYGNNSGGWKQPEIQNKQPKNINYKGSFRGGRAVHSGCRKREGPLQHSSRYKTSRFQGDSRKNITIGLIPKFEEETTCIKPSSQTKPMS